MAAINAQREIDKVEATIKKLDIESRLAAALIKRHETKASASTFTGYTDSELAEYAKNQAIVKNNAAALQREQQLLAALHAAKAAKPLFKTAMVGEEGADGNFYIDDVDQFDALMEGEEGVDDELDELEGEWNKEEEDELSAFASVTAQLKLMGFDPEKYAPAAPAAQAKTNEPLLPHEAKSSTSGDNDILRYAKLGDIESFRNEENIEGVNPATFLDNNHRTCLHYAADGGSAELVKYLLERGLSPMQPDDKGITPLAIAVILQRKACVDLMAEHVRTKEKSFVASSMLDPVAQSQALIPSPPRFVMSKGAPAPRRTATTHSGERTKILLWRALLPSTLAPPLLTRRACCASSQAQTAR